MEDVFEQLEPWLIRHRRTAWIPITADGDGGLAESKFSGTPFLPDGAWPTCGDCKRPLQLWLQLNLASLPLETHGRFGEGLMQFFLCTHSDGECAYKFYGDPFAPCQVVRLIPFDASTPMVGPPQLEFKEAYPAKRITAWTAIDDHPAVAEHEELGLVLSHDDDELQCPELGIGESVDFDVYVDWTDGHTVADDKLAGWPTWEQNVEYANCPKCGERMDTMVFQFGSQENIPFMLADGGRGQIIQCPQHKNVLGFVWASG